MHPWSPTRGHREQMAQEPFRTEMIRPRDPRGTLFFDQLARDSKNNRLMPGASERRAKGSQARGSPARPHGGRFALLSSSCPAPAALALRTPGLTSHAPTECGGRPQRPGPPPAPGSPHPAPCTETLTCSSPDAALPPLVLPPPPPPPTELLSSSVPRGSLRASSALALIPGGGVRAPRATPPVQVPVTSGGGRGGPELRLPLGRAGPGGARAVGAAAGGGVPPGKARDRLPALACGGT